MVVGGGEYILGGNGWWWVFLGSGGSWWIYFGWWVYFEKWWVVMGLFCVVVSGGEYFWVVVGCSVTVYNSPFYNIHQVRYYHFFIES